LTPLDPGAARPSSGPPGFLAIRDALGAIPNPLMGEAVAVAVLEATAAFVVIGFSSLD